MEALENEKGSDQGFRSGFVTLLGRPNSGKSTLINAVMGKKLAITSDTPQTTRHRFRAIRSTDAYQLILVDTPGIHKPHNVLGEELNLSAQKAIESVDAIAFVLDATKPFGTGDEWIVDIIKATNIPRFLVISKTDLADKGTISSQIAAARAAGDFDSVVDVSAVEGKGIETFVELAVSFLPQGPLWFPADMTCDQPIEVIISEFIREKVIVNTFDEVPHATCVQVEEFSFDKKKGLYSIYANIYVGRDSQKGILIGTGGEKIKQIGTQARIDLAHMLGGQVFLELRVKLRKAWWKDLGQIRRFGYGEGS